MRKTDTKPRILEDDILVGYFDWIRLMANQDVRYEYILHIPNEANRGKWGHVRANEKGLAKGIPDVLCLYPHRDYQGFALEFKSETGKTTPEQEIWLERLARIDFRVAIVRSIESAKRLTEGYFF